MKRASWHRDPDPKLSENEIVEYYADAYLPYPAEFEVHTRTSDPREVGYENRAPRHASNFRADMVVHMPRCELAVEAKRFEYKSPWFERGRLYDGIGQTMHYSRFYDLAELWHFLVVHSEATDRTIESAKRTAREMHDYVTSWGDGSLPFGYRVIGVSQRESRVSYEFDVGETAANLGYNPSAQPKNLSYPFNDIPQP